MTASNMHSLQASASWQRIDLIADLHLQVNEPRTFDTWAHFMLHTQADAIFILGDLFEVWVGDDAVDTDPFLQKCQQVLQTAGYRRNVFFVHGNRDFLVGQALLHNCNIQLLPDPTCLSWGEQRYLLSHGDALCLDDLAYQTFRKSCRTQAWQQSFLSKPLAQRQALAREMRDASQAAQAAHSYDADPDTALCLQWLRDCHASTLIHGHTHRPADHVLDQNHRRIVLSDWSLDHLPPRAQVLRLYADGDMQRLQPDQA